MTALKLKRFVQDPGCCATAGCSSVANFYNPIVSYDLGKVIAKKHVTRNIGDGLESGQTGLLLNKLGFKRVTIISSDIDYLDYTWSKLSKKDKIEKLEEARRKLPYKNCRSMAKNMSIFLQQKEYNNKLVIDYNFGKYIRGFLDQDKPVLVSFNWNIYFQYVKVNGHGPDPLAGDYDDHLVCCRGYNDKGVQIVDSHDRYYKYRLKKYKKGSYTMSWENLMSCMGFGDVILPEAYDEDVIEV